MNMYDLGAADLACASDGSLYVSALAPTALPMLPVVRAGVHFGLWLLNDEHADHVGTSELRGHIDYRDVVPFAPPAFSCWPFALTNLQHMEESRISPCNGSRVLMHVTAIDSEPTVISLHEVLLVEQRVSALQ